MNYGWQFWVDHQPWSGGKHDLRITRVSPDGTRGAIVEFKMIDAPEGLAVPIVETHTREAHEDGIRSFLQAALDAAWDAGLRPYNYEDTRQEIAAVRYHLEDMRVLAKVRER